MPRLPPPPVGHHVRFSFVIVVPVCLNYEAFWKYLLHVFTLSVENTDFHHPRTFRFRSESKELTQRRKNMHSLYKVLAFRQAQTAKDITRLKAPIIIIIIIIIIDNPEFLWRD
jgi:hypothetical protein